jgi:hypothetical protein
VKVEFCHRVLFVSDLRHSVDDIEDLLADYQCLGESLDVRVEGHERHESHHDRDLHSQEITYCIDYMRSLV